MTTPPPNPVHFLHRPIAPRTNVLPESNAPRFDATAAVIVAVKLRHCPDGHHDAIPRVFDRDSAL